MFVVHLDLQCNLHCSLVANGFLLTSLNANEVMNLTNGQESLATVLENCQVYALNAVVFDHLNIDSMVSSIDRNFVVSMATFVPIQCIVTLLPLTQVVLRKFEK